MVRILVPLRQTVDANVVVRALPDGSGVDAQGAALVINPFDEIALEAALQQKEQGRAVEVVVASIGPAEVERALRTALAMGADRALLVRTQAQALPAAPVAAALLAALARREDAGLVLMGKQAIDDDLGMTAQMLAARLGWPQAMFAASLQLEDDSAVVVCEHDVGTRTLRLPLPCVVAADLRLAEPRFVSLANVMKARRKPLEVLDVAQVAELAGEALPAVAEPLRLLRVAEVRQRRQQQMLPDADALVRQLHQQGLWPQEES